MKTEIIETWFHISVGMFIGFALVGMVLAIVLAIIK